METKLESPETMEPEGQERVDQRKRNNVVVQDMRRRATLITIDHASTSLSHVRAVVVAGTGFFTGAYDLFSANFITTMIGLAHYQTHSIPTSADAAVKLSTTAGAVIGQVVFGWLADKFGRKRMYGLELIVILIGTLGQSISGAGRGLGILDRADSISSALSVG